MSDSLIPHRSEMDPLREAIEMLGAPRLSTSETAADTLGTMAMASHYLRIKTIQVNEALAKSHELDSAERSAAEQGAKEIFEALCEIHATVRHDLFNPMLREEIGFTEGESEGLLKGLKSASNCTDILARALARDDMGPDRIAKVRETPEWRRAVKGASARAVEPGSYFAPLLNCISKEAAPALKAELTAKMELYIQSGWAARDCWIDTTELQTPAARSIRDLCDEFRAPSRGAGGSFGKINARFNELFLNVSVKRIAGINGEETATATVETNESTPSNHAAKAGTGRVDAVIRDARDSAVLHAAVVTTDVSTLIEGDQLYRHHAALAEGMRSGAIPGARSLKLSFYVPSVFYDATPEDGRDIGTPFIGAMKDSLTEEERGRLNLMPYLSVIGRLDRSHPHFRVDALADFNLRIIGASSARWNDTMRRVRSIQDPEVRQGAFLRAVATEVGGAIDVFGKKVIDGTKLSSANSNDILLSSFCSTLEGATHHAADIPKTLAPIAERIQGLRVFKAQISGDSGTRRRLETEILKYTGAGGVEAWANAARTVERDEARLTQDQSTRTRIDQASSHAMLTEFITARACDPQTRPTIASLSSDLARDTKARFGFTERQAGAIRELIDTTAFSPAQRLANARYLSASERGSIPDVEAALSEGAYLFALDSRGRDSVALADRAGHGNAAAWLREKAKQETLAGETAVTRALSWELKSASNQRV